MAVKPIPEGYHAVTPTLNVKGAAKLIDFLKSVFGAQERMRMPGPGGAIMHAEVQIGDSVVMLSDAIQQPPISSSLFVYVTDADATYQRALKAGAKSVMEPADMFWGDRFSSVEDAFGNSWGIATHKEDVPPDELTKRAAAFTASQGSRG
jgi:PhnB protein